MSKFGLLELLVSQTYHEIYFYTLFFTLGPGITSPEERTHAYLEEIAVKIAKLVYCTNKDITYRH